MRSVSTRKTSKQKPAATRRAPPRKAAPRKTPSKPPLVRGEAVVQKVLDAALEELAHTGYLGFRIEEVALRAEVNKTTVYRRWPTKPELVRDALSAASNAGLGTPATGALRTDLLAMARIFVQRATDPIGQSLVRMLSAEGSDPEVKEIARTMRERHQAAPRAVLANAVARGELAPGIDHMVIIEALIGALHHRIFWLDKPADEAFLTELIDLLLLGAVHARGRQRDDGTADGPAPEIRI